MLEHKMFKDRLVAITNTSGHQGWAFTAVTFHGVAKDVEPGEYTVSVQFKTKPNTTEHWFHDHNESTKTRPRFKNAFCFLVCTLRIGKTIITVDLRLYLRQKTVRRINRHRPPGQRVPFRNKNRLARSMLEALRPLLPKGWYMCVQFDSWYASEKLIKYVHRHGWHVTCGLKRNRNLNGKRIDRLAYALRHRRYTHVRMPAADEDPPRYSG